MRKPPTAKGKLVTEKVFASQKIRKPEAPNKFEMLINSKRKQMQKTVQDRQGLVQEFKGLNKSNRILDKRAIEDPKIATKLLVENKVKLLPATTKRSKKLKFFELDSDDEVLELTHLGKKIGEIDDFKNEDVRVSSGEDEGKIGASIVDDYHFSGFYEPNKDNSQPGERKKSRQEIFSELIHKSKKAKFERQQLAMENQVKKEKLNEDFQDIQHLLVGDSRQIKEESKKKNLTDDYYNMASLLRDDKKVQPEMKVSEDPKKRERPRKNAKMVDENEEGDEDEDSEEKEEDDFEMSDVGDDTDVRMDKKMPKGKMNQILKNERTEKKRVRFVDEIRKMKKDQVDESDSVGSDEEDEFDLEDNDDEDGSGMEDEDGEDDGQFEEEDDEEADS